MQSGERWLENRYTGNNQKKKKNLTTALDAKVRTSKMYNRM